MQSWQVGAVKITRIIESEAATPYRPNMAIIAQATPDAVRAIPWLSPHFATAEGHLIFSVHALVVEAPGLRMVVDTCIGNDKPRRLTRGRALQSGFLHAFEAAGFARDTIDAVLCTHLHVDHVGWNTMRDGERWVPTFPRAAYLFARTELEHWLGDSADEEQQTVLADSVQPILDAGLAQRVEMDHVITPEVRLQPTPGHTPGHVSVLIESEGQRALITGDVMHHPCQIAEPDWSTPFDSDRAAAIAMRRELLAALADRPTLVIGTHFATPTAGHVKRSGERFRFEV